MTFLRDTLKSLVRNSKNAQIRHIEQHLSQYETWKQLHLLKQILCLRSPTPPLPENLCSDIDHLLIRSRKHRILTLASSIPALARLRQAGNKEIQIKIWQGDITSLASDVTAITNAANSQMLGCFQPSHKCIDNVIHSMAGPRLRQECFDIMESRDCDLPVGEALVTKGYCLPSPYVIHTVGPQLARGVAPTDEEKHHLRQCYVSVLEQAEGLPSSEDGSKRIALCGISTGLFAFPSALAAKIAVDTVLAWFAHHESTSITEIIFVTFAEGDFDTYTSMFRSIPLPWHSLSPPPLHQPHLSCTTLSTAQTWLVLADKVLISAGAGLSAAEGLDYTSKALFEKHFPAFIPFGLNTLYSAIGFSRWPSETYKWSYYFHNVAMVRNWPEWPMYKDLISWLKASGKQVHIRTSNADGLFLANGWEEEKLSTPQGRYSVLQCLQKCREDATFAMQPYFEAAVPFLDPVTQDLTDKSKVPRCKFCGGDLMICVRGGNWFNERPFAEGEKRWKDYRRDLLKGDGKTVILEIGVGMNTPGVLRWPNEDLVRKGNGRVKLIRVGMGVEAMVPEDLEEEDLAVYIEGNVKNALPLLLEQN